MAHKAPDKTFITDNGVTYEVVWNGGPLLPEEYPSILSPAANRILDGEAWDPPPSHWSEQELLHYLRALPGADDEI